MNVDAVAQGEIEEAQAKFPEIPGDYLAFLEEIGWGNFSRVMLYSGPDFAGDLFAYLKDEIPKIVLFGDDFQGYFYGFDSEAGYHLVEVSPDGTVEALEMTFEAFIRRKLNKSLAG